MENFQVFVKPVGAACNLACTYCYYLDKQKLNDSESGLRMRDDLLERYILQHISASAEPEIFFSWHGGEPTMSGLDFFERAIALQQKYLPANRKIINGLQTNGTLLNNEWYRFLKRENFIVGISLDGPEKFHTLTRIRKDGKSSYDDVMRGLTLLQKYEVPFEILCVVNSMNVHYPLEVYRFFKKQKAGFITFLPLVEQEDSGKVSQLSVSARDFGEFLCAVFEEWKNEDIGELKIQVIEEALRTAFGLEHSLCVFKKCCGRVPVVESNGDFYSCDHFVDQEHLIGNISSQSLSGLLESKEQIAFGDRKQSTLPGFCQCCEVIEMCNGACPKDRFINTPDGQAGLNYLCDGYKLFFKHIKPFAEMIAKVWKENEL